MVLLTLSIRRLDANLCEVEARWHSVQPSVFIQPMNAAVADVRVLPYSP